MADPRTHALGLIGTGISLSRSPAIHETEAAELGIPLTYRLIDFATLGLIDSDLARIVRLLQGMGFSGSNVTYPFKQAVLPLCDTLSEAARTLGAVNTLVFSKTTIHGDNTDWVGFSWQIEREIGDIVGQTVAQIGAGGAGSATAYALARHGAGCVSLFDPTPEKAKALAARLAPAFPDCRFIAAASAADAISGAAGIVNATPVGMDTVPGMPFAPELMASSQWFTDVIYIPLETELLAAARTQGQIGANGVSMVVGQAAEAFRVVTGVPPDRERMLRRLLDGISAEQTSDQAS